MIKTEKRGFGYKIDFGGVLKIDDILKFKDEISVYINSSKEKFSIYYDLRSIQYFAKDAQLELNALRAELKAKGLIRSTIILNKQTDKAKMEILKIPYDETERILFPFTELNFEIVGINWLTREIDPNIKILKRKKLIADDMKLKG